MTAMEELERRIARLEALEEIKSLKARYWYACDRKDVQAVRDCFADGNVTIDYDGPAGVLEHRDQLYALFEATSCKPEMVEIHHGAAPILEIVDDTHAKGGWGLVYQLTNTDTKIVSHAGGYYEDDYEKIEGRWYIRRARFRVCSSYMTGYKKDGAVKVLHAGPKLPMPR